jgi:outer membrane receptor for ferrienterochelin and colicins
MKRSSWARLLCVPSLVATAVVDPLAAQVIYGRVTASQDRRPVAHAEIATSSGAWTATGAEGRYRLVGLPVGPDLRLTIRAPGFRTTQRTVSLASGDTLRLDLTLESEIFALDPLVVTGTLTETRLSESPVKVEVVSSRLLDRNRSSNLMDAIGNINGLYPHVDCGVCYTNNIRINGMEGPYTAVLIDGMPIMGALASVYGLNGIDPALVQQLEIVKGPQSTLYGTEAMGGVVNVITKDARFAPRYAVEATRSNLGETTASIALAPHRGPVRALVSASLVHNDRFVDENADGFSDLTLDTRLSFFAKAGFYDEGREVAQAVAKVYHEDRFGGVADWTPEHRGSDRVYGESILTNRVEAMGRAILPGPHLKASASVASHRQDSWYGDTRFRATQHVALAQLLWDPPRRGALDPLAGVALRLDDYQDNTPATATASDRRSVPGVFGELTWYPHAAWALLGGFRVDRHRAHGAIGSPRASVKWQPTGTTVFRINAGTGFRIVNLFTEDHAALTGAREVVVEEGLSPERSRSLAFNWNQEIAFGSNPMRVDLDLFHTRFSNRIVPDYDSDPNQIRYANLDGHAVTRGVSLAFNQNVITRDLFYTLGVTWQAVTTTRVGATERETFAPRYRGVWTVSKRFAGRFTLDWTGNVTGPMRLPAYPEPHSRPTRSRPYAVHNLQATYDMAPGRELRLAVQNVAGFTQGSPLIAPADPFGPDFDTNYVWGPVVGRRIVFGMRWSGSR